MVSGREQLMSELDYEGSSDARRETARTAAVAAPPERLTVGSDAAAQERGEREHAGA
jgi:hypothetical protein